MKFSIASLLTAMTIAALAMLSVRQRKSFANQEKVEWQLRQDIAANRHSYLVARAHVPVVKEVLSSPFISEMEHAEANFAALQEHRLQSELAESLNVRIWSIPVIAEEEQVSWYRYRVSIPSNQTVELVSDVLGQDGKPTRKGNAFLPANCVYPLPTGDCVIDIRVTRETQSGGFNMQPNMAYLFHLSVHKSTEDLDGDADFLWKTKYLQPEAPRETGKRYHNAYLASNAKPLPRLFYASRMSSGRSRESLHIFLRRTEGRGLLKEVGR